MKEDNKDVTRALITRIGIKKLKATLIAKKVRPLPHWVMWFVQLKLINRLHQMNTHIHYGHCYLNHHSLQMTIVLTITYSKMARQREKRRTSSDVPRHQPLTGKPLFKSEAAFPLEKILIHINQVVEEREDAGQSLHPQQNCKISLEEI